MKNIYEVLGQKESELLRIQKEIEALRLAAQLLADESEAQPEAAPNMPALRDQSAAASPQSAAALAGKGGHSAAWDNVPHLPAIPMAR